MVLHQTLLTHCHFRPGSQRGMQVVMSSVQHCRLSINHSSTLQLLPQEPPSRQIPPSFLCTATSKVQLTLRSTQAGFS